MHQDLLRKCASVLGLAGIAGYLTCAYSHYCMDGHLWHSEDGITGFYFDSIWLTAILLSVATSINSNLWFKPLFWGGLAIVLVCWMRQICRDTDLYLDDDLSILAIVALLMVIVLSVRGLRWPSKKLVTPCQDKFVIALNIIVGTIFIAIATGLVIAIRYGINRQFLH
jgi:hypothetical protein